MTTRERVALWRCGSCHNRRGALIVLLHAHGTDERSIFRFADALPGDATVVALRGPIAEGEGFAWFTNDGLGRPIAASIGETINDVQRWLDAYAGDAEELWLLGVGGGAAIASALVLHAPQRCAGAALVGSTLPVHTRIPSLGEHLLGVELFVADRIEDAVAWFAARFTTTISHS